jgi:hypothetical protein
MTHNRKDQIILHKEYFKLTGRGWWEPTKERSTEKGVAGVTIMRLREWLPVDKKDQKWEGEEVDAKPEREYRLRLWVHRRKRRI